MAKNEAVLSVVFNNFVIRSKIVAITAVNTSPIKKDIKVAKEQNRLIDATMGKKVKSVIFLDSNQVVLSALTPHTLQLRFVSDSEE